MKGRFTTLDVMAAVHDLQCMVGMRVLNVYDVNSKTYLIRLREKEEKSVILLESGIRIHRTYHDWPKSQFPSGFSMKMRKHMKNCRLESVKQLGVDRVVDLTFGDNERAVHVIVELYDRGNVLLTDHDYTILNILRPRTDKDTDVKLSVREKYPMDLARQTDTLPSASDLEKAISGAKKGDNLRRLLAPMVQLGGPLIDHSLFLEGFPQNAQIETNVGVSDVPRLVGALSKGAEVYENIKTTPCKGFVTYKEEKRASGEAVKQFQDYHPFLFAQCQNGQFQEFLTFSEAVDEFYSLMESQKAEQRALNIEREALKRLDNVKRDQEQRIEALEECQLKQKEIGERIILNKDLVEKALMIMRAMIAGQHSWDQIEEMRAQAAKNGDETAQRIIKLKLDQNQFIMRLGDPYHEETETMDVPIDIGLNAFQNSRKYFVDKKAAALKQQKTVAASAKAVKSAQQKAKETLEQVRIRTDVAKTRKPMWFEKFLWFISSENYVVVAGRDAQQNELLVKRYLRTGDIYMHADLRGASSVIVRNKPGKGDIPPKTLHEAAQMAVCNSNAWDAKVVANAWWVHHDQVSRTAPSGEYLSSGSFMIRGKKNFMPASQLVMGFALMFKLDEESIERHKGERKVVNINDGPEEQIQGEQEIDEEVEVEKEEEDDKNEETEEFPDVQVNVAGLHLRDNNDEEYSIIEIGPKVVRGGPVGPKEGTKQFLEQKRLEEEKKEVEKAKTLAGPSKRQKRKEKLIKKKYGDQDEEERQLRMALIGNKSKNEEIATVVDNDQPTPEKSSIPDLKSKPERAPRQKNEDKDEEIDKDEQDTIEDSDAVLDSLTGKPLDEDALMYCVPVVAPYNALSNYKFKVKLTPGTGKRGKAAKSALELFLRSKRAGTREDALIRALVGDEAAARNIPGKVRVSAPQLHAK